VAKLAGGQQIQAAPERAAQADGVAGGRGSWFIGARRGGRAAASAARPALWEAELETAEVPHR